MQTVEQLFASPQVALSLKQFTHVLLRPPQMSLHTHVRPFAWLHALRRLCQPCGSQSSYFEQNLGQSTVVVPESETEQCTDSCGGASFAGWQ